MRLPSSAQATALISEILVEKLKLAAHGHYHTYGESRYTGEVVRRTSDLDQAAHRQVRVWTRFLHTGEALGWAAR